MRSRSAVLWAAAAALLASAAVTTSAGAACRPLLTDKAGDAQVAAPAGPNVDALDVRSLSVATGKSELVVALEVGAPADSADSFAPLGRSWTVTFSVGVTQYSVARGRTAGATATPTASATGDGKAIPVTVTVTGNTIAWHLKRSQVSKLKKGSVLSNFFVNVNSPVAHDYAPDSAQKSSVTYKDRAASCAKAA
jgi:hypothetical protein